MLKFYVIISIGLIFETFQTALGVKPVDKDSPNNIKPFENALKIEQSADGTKRLVVNEVGDERVAAKYRMEKGCRILLVCLKNEDGPEDSTTDPEQMLEKLNTLDGQKITRIDFGI